MPPVIAAFAAWAGITVAAAWAIAAVVVVSAGMAVYGSAQARRAERQARDDLNAAMKDRMITRIATEAPHRYIYGRAKVGSDIVAMFTSGARDEFKHIVCVHAAHECDAIEEVYVNNVAVGLLDDAGNPTSGRYATTPFRQFSEETHVGPTFDLSFDPVAGSIKAFSGVGAAMAPIAVTGTSGRTVTVANSGTVTVLYEYRDASNFGDTTPPPQPTKPVVRVHKHLGTPDDPVDSYLYNLTAGRWPATAVLRGLCYTVITLDLNHPEFQGGLVPIHALIRGRKLYDPRTGLTAWSQNAALATMDYLTSPLCGVAMSDLPMAQYIAAANVCDETTDVAGGRYTINGTVTSDQNQTTVLEAMAQAMAGSLVSTTWDIAAGKYIAPVASLDQSDIVGGLQITPGISDASVYNGVKGQFIGPENNYVLTDFKPYQNATYLASDGRDLYTNLDFPFTDSLQRVTNLARIFTEDQRNGFTIKADFSLKAWPLKVGQRITFNSALLGQSAKVYRVTDKSFAPNSPVQLTLKEDDPSIWDFADAVVVDSTPNSDLPDPWEVLPLTSLSCTSGEATLLRQADGTMVPRILVSWPAAATASVFTGGQIVVEWRAVSSTAWNRVTVSGSETQTYLAPITPGYFYVVRARCVNPNLNTSSDWIATTYQVQVFSARPVVYKWAASQPAAPSGASSYSWGTQSYAAPAGWSLTKPAAPAGGGVSMWEAGVQVADISVSGSTPFAWDGAAVAAKEYAPTPDLGSAVTAAQASADAANAAIANISSDNVLSKGEKAQVVLDWNTILGEKSGIDTQADALAVSRTAYDNAYTALYNYLTGLVPSYTDTTTDTTIVGATFRSKFTDYYSARQALLNAMAAKAATMASGVTITSSGALAGAGGGQVTLPGMGLNSFRAVSMGTGAAGYTVGRGIYVNGANTPAYTPARSYMVVVIDRSSSLITSATSYDVFGDPAQATAMANALNALTSSSIVVVLTYDEPRTNRLLNGLPAAMYRCGAGPTIFGSVNFPYRGAYILVGIPGIGTGNGAELSAPTTAGWVDMSFNVIGGNITGVSSTTTPQAMSDYGFTGDANANFSPPSKGNCLNDDPALEKPSAWSLSSSHITYNTYTSGTPVLNVAGSHFFDVLGFFATPPDLTVESVNKFAIDPNKTYSLTANLYAASGNDRNMYIFVNFFDAAGALLATSWGGTRSGYVFGSSPTPIGQWCRCGGQFGVGTSRAIPAAARTASVGVWFQYSGAGSSNVEQAAQDIRLEPVINAALLDATTNTAITNFNASNDRNSAAVTAPTIVTDGTAVDHTIRTDGSADISFEWVWGGNEGDIDGFLVYVYQSATSGAYSFGTTPYMETVYPVPANKRAFILCGAAANLYTTFGVQAYRSVDKDIASTGTIKSLLLKPSAAGENPYLPSASVAFGGDVNGTVSGTAAATVVANAAAGASASTALANKPVVSISTTVGTNYPNNTMSYGTFTANVAGGNGASSCSWTINNTNPNMTMKLSDSVGTTVSLLYVSGDLTDTEGDAIVTVIATDSKGLSSTPVNYHASIILGIPP